MRSSEVAARELGARSPSSVDGLVSGRGRRVSEGGGAEISVARAFRVISLTFSTSTLRRSQLQVSNAIGEVVAAQMFRAWRRRESVKGLLQIA